MDPGASSKFIVIMGVTYVSDVFGERVDLEVWREGVLRVK